MAKIFVYYSATGSGDLLANFLSKQGYEILKLEMEKPIRKMNFFKMIHYGGQAAAHKKAVLKPYVFKEKDYEKILIGSPVWADNLSTPINAFLADHPLHEASPVFLFYSLGGECKKGQRIVKKMYPKAICFDLLSPKKDLSKAEALLTKIL